MMFSTTIAMHTPTLYITEVTSEFIAARRQSMQRGVYTLGHFLEEGLVRLRAADVFEKLTGDRPRRNQFVSTIVNWLQVCVSQTLEKLAGDVLFPFETLQVVTPTPASAETSRNRIE
jgi:hypothetical protein